MVIPWQAWLRSTSDHVAWSSVRDREAEMENLDQHSSIKTLLLSLRQIRSRWTHCCYVAWPFADALRVYALFVLFFPAHDRGTASAPPACSSNLKASSSLIALHPFVRSPSAFMIDSCRTGCVTAEIGSNHEGNAWNWKSILQPTDFKANRLSPFDIASSSQSNW